MKPPGAEELDEQDKNDAINWEKVEHASDIIGDWGPFQFRIFLFTSIIYMISPFHNKALVFYAPKIDYWCKRPDGFENATIQTCASYENPNISCTEWEYDLSFYTSTIIDQFDLVCNRAWMVSAAQSCFQIGYLISSIVVGIFSDRFGRLTALKICVAVEIITAFFLAISPNIYAFMMARLVGGIAGFGRYLSSYLLVMESVGPRLRARMGPCTEFGWSIGVLLQPGIYYLVRHYQHMQFMVTGAEIVMSVLLFWVNESPRWQLTHGQFDKASKVILKAAEKKGELTPAQAEAKLARLKQFLDKDEESRHKEENQTLLDVYREPRLLRYCILLYVLWFVMSFISYGITFNIGDLGGSLYVNVFIMALATSVSRIALVFIVDRLSRRKLLSLSFFGGAGCYMAMAFMTRTTAPPIYLSLLASLGSMFFTGVVVVNYLYGTEIFPTTVRQIGLGSCSVCARFGSIAAPFLRELTAWTYLSVTLSIFAVMSTIAGCLVYFLPETQKKDIPDMISESKKEAESDDTLH